MKNFVFKCVIAVCFVIILFFLVMVELGMVHAEEIPEENYITLYVTGSSLNCRMSPNKESFIVTELEKGQEIQSTGRWSKDHRWVEIVHPECGNLWCDYHYLTERTDNFIVETLCDDPVKIRRQVFNGKIKGHLRKGRTLEITQVILGWGKCKEGWIDLSYCIEVE